MMEFLESLADCLEESAGLLYIILFCVPLLILCTTYILRGLTLTSLCHASGQGRVFMAWIPFLNLYLLGLQADVYTHDRVLRGELPPRYMTSALRRRMTGFSIVNRIAEGVAAAAWVLALLTGFSGFLMAIMGGLFEIRENVGAAESLLGVFVAGFLTAVLAYAVAILFRILYLVASCKAHYRLFHMLDAPSPALWGVAAILLPVLATVMLFVYTRKRREGLTDRFFPPFAESAYRPTDDSEAQGLGTDHAEAEL